MYVMEYTRIQKSVCIIRIVQLAELTICGHVGSDVRALRLQRHLVDVSQHLRRALRRWVALPTEGQGACRRHIRMNLHCDEGVKCASEARIASWSDVNILEAMPCKQRAKWFAVPRAQDVVLGLLHRPRDLGVHCRRRLRGWPS